MFAHPLTGINRRPQRRVVFEHVTKRDLAVVSQQRIVGECGIERVGDVDLELDQASQLVFTHAPQRRRLRYRGAQSGVGGHHLGLNIFVFELQLRSIVEVLQKSDDLAGFVGLVIKLIEEQDELRKPVALTLVHLANRRSKRPNIPVHNHVPPDDIRLALADAAAKIVNDEHVVGLRLLYHLLQMDVELFVEKVLDAVGIRERLSGQFRDNLVDLRLGVVLSRP